MAENQHFLRTLITTAVVENADFPTDCGRWSVKCSKNKLFISLFAC